MSWLSTKTRPDLALAVNKLQQRTAAPRDEDLAAIKGMFRYLRGTMKLGIALNSSSNDGENDLHGYVDASHQDCTDGHSTEGYIFFMNNTPISWRSAKQKVVALAQPSQNYEKKVCIKTDSDNAVALLKKDGYSSTTEWIDNRYFFVKEAMKEGLIELILISDDDNIADGLTKPLAVAKFDKFQASLTLTEPPTALNDETGTDRHEVDYNDDDSDEIDKDVDELA
ncbi:hypothetical protein NUU61_001389 [Penicillium alfredii]|uniref:Reverse transcriptase Ty1/copia-type domain-containing protein n=1 Tax=Penicillium alfredii TaxID=1506179 RepID=A0A9W9G417_9EURO|nr:uncharacterized protein NUU61_001389 [Penicillium alfredii]KAJ5111759.1 hypothetical protein NUU61_001389 [Penicillium alfredii]